MERRSRHFSVMLLLGALIMGAPTAVRSAEAQQAQGGSAPQTLAVLPIINAKVAVRVQTVSKTGQLEDRTESKEAYSIGVTLYDMRSLEAFIAERIQQIPVYRLVERADLDAILDEQDLLKTGIVNDTDVAGVGKLVGARLLLQPYINSIDNLIEGDPSNEGFRSNRIVAAVSMKLLDVETSQLLWAGTGKGEVRAPSNASELAAIEAAFHECTNKLIEYVNRAYGLQLKTRKLYTAKSPGLAVALSVVPGVGQIYAGNPEGGKETAVMALAGAGGAYLITRTATWQRVTGWVLAGSAGFCYLSSFFNAYSSASKYNVEMGLAVENGQAGPGWPGVRAGVSLRF